MEHLNEQHSGTPTHTAAASPRPRSIPMTPGQQSVLRLQRQAGNRAVTALIPRATGTVQRDGETPPTPLLAQAALTRAENIRAAATVRLGKVAAYNSTADVAIGAYRDMRTRFATTWGGAWDRHNRKLAEGNEAAASQNFIEGIVIGAAAAVLITAAATVAFPAAAAAAPFTAAWWAFNVGSNTVSSVAGSAAASAVGRPSVAPPTTGKRDAEADGWRKVAEAEHAARAVSAVAPKFGLELGNAEYCIAQVKAQLNGGKGADMNWDKTLDMVSTMANWELGLARFDAEIDSKLEAMTAFGQAAQNFKVPSIDDLEKDIWRAWMSTLDNDTDEALDQDVIQHYLEKLGLIPDYFYMTDEDQHRAVADAKAHLADAGVAP